MKKSPKSKKKFYIITTLVVVVFYFIVAILISSNDQSEPVSEDIPLEEVREQASDAFLTNDETVDAADIDVGLG